MVRLRVVPATCEHLPPHLCLYLVTYEAYQAKIEYDEDLDQFRGEVLGLNGGADFYGEKNLK